MSEGSKCELENVKQSSVVPEKNVTQNNHDSPSVKENKLSAMDVIKTQETLKVPEEKTNTTLENDLVLSEAKQKLDSSNAEKVSTEEVLSAVTSTLNNENEDNVTSKEEQEQQTSCTEQKENAPKEEILSISNKNEDNVARKSSEESSKDEHAENVSYTEDGTAIYTDPKTNYQYKWCTKDNNWIPKDSSTSTNPYENEHYKWCTESQKWIPKQTQVTETEHYKWDAEKNEWVPKVKDLSQTEQTKASGIVYDVDEKGQRTYIDKDGVVFFWDVEKNAWFPKIDDDFMARYQMSYGFIDNTSESEREKEKRELEAAEQKEKELARMVEEAKANEQISKQGVKRKQLQEPPKWFEMDPAHNTKVYVSNLPSDITLEEFAEVMGKCGMIMRDPQTQKYKLKLYTESDGQIKGDGLCDYIKVESVDLALKILDEYDLRGHKIRVQRAKFQMRGEYNPSLKPKRKKKDKEKLAKIKEKLFDWRPEKMRGERSKHEKTVIIKNLFHPDLFEKEVQLILDYQTDLREECSKCGTVRKVVVYDRHPEGVAQVNMSSPEEADLVIQMMHGRYFGKRQLTAEHWDGKTKYKIEETEKEIQSRLNKWDQYLETEEKEKSSAGPLKQMENETIQPITGTFEDTTSLEQVNLENAKETNQNQEAQNNKSTTTTSTTET